MKKRILFIISLITVSLICSVVFHQLKLENIDHRLNNLESKQEQFETKLFNFRKSFEKTIPFENGTHILFKVHGSNTLGDQLVPELAKKYLLQLGAIDNIEYKTNSKFPDRIIVRGKFKGEDKPYGIEIYAGGSSTAFSHLFSDLCEIGMSSRVINEKDLNDQPLKSINESIIALDGIAIAVHPNNQIRELSTDQIKEIFSGKINNWKEIGGQDKDIHVLKRDSRSGTLSFFKEHLMNSEELSVDSKTLHSQRDMQLAISKDEQSIGFLSLPFLEGLRAISLKATESSIAITPNEFTISSEDYPITRRLYLYTLNSLKNNFAIEFLNFATGDQSYESIQNTGFTSLKVYNNTDKQISEPSEELPSDYKEITSSAQRLSVTIRFSQNQSQLDSRSIGDVIRLVRTLEESSEKIKQVYLVGFTDNKGDPQTNLKVSAERADFIKNLILENTNLISSEQITASGLGSYKPIASNNTASGQLKNRRVEVWVLSK